MKQPSTRKKYVRAHHHTRLACMYANYSLHEPCLCIRDSHRDAGRERETGVNVGTQTSARKADHSCASAITAADQRDSQNNLKHFHLTPTKCICIQPICRQNITSGLRYEKEGHSNAAIAVVYYGQCSLVRALCPYGELPGLQ